MILFVNVLSKLPLGLRCKLLLRCFIILQLFLRFLHDQNNYFCQKLIFILYYHRNAK